MRNKSLAVLVILCLLLPVSVGARSLLNVSLGFGAAYSPDEETEFSLGMEDPNNWLFGGEVSARLAFLQAQAMIFPIQCNEEETGILMIGIGSLSLPILGPLLSLELGAGVGVTYVPTNSTVSKSYYALAQGAKADAEDVTFGEAVWKSPVYLQAGLGTEVGPITVKLRYLMESQKTVGSALASDAWWGAFALEKRTLSLALALKMF
ncbi:MAG: hypothetical protein RBU26_04025 [Sphaerochaeta sp.]|jgi:hypothetical protein|uniref:hypothetical protein n=1 Tax=Sphaerochaeta sp. TaxID=1972642 RepID=UPI002A370E9F|nr:hypothetical protein [Sphaerochaeta sp.]MDX9824089.1 hypothetical protein [Sphaerochaeta sp.]